MASALLTNAQRALQEGRYAVALELLEQYLAKTPGDVAALSLARHAAANMGASARVLPLFEHLEDAGQLTPETEHLWIASLLDCQRIDDAKARAETILQNHPDAVPFSLQLGRCHLAVGDLSAAREAFWAVHQARPDDVMPLTLYLQAAGSEDIAKLNAPLDRLWETRASLPSSDRAALAFTRGAVAERLNNIEEAWACYTEGNAIRSAEERFSEAAATQYQLALRDEFARAGIVDEASPIGSEMIIIVSMPRSGSTLVEQILGSHSKATPIGERSLAAEAFALWQQGRNAEALNTAREHYLEGARRFAGGADGKIVEKGITNFMFVGFLRMLLPGARFVHVVRNPLDTCLSCFATNFAPGAVKWTYDLHHMAGHVKRYQVLMKGWSALWPEVIMTLRYEDLVAEPEATARALLDHAGLEWEPACLSFHTSKAAVTTASAAQVREPLHARATGRATKFEKFLAPLAAEIGASADPDWFLNP